MKKLIVLFALITFTSCLYAQKEIEISLLEGEKIK
jgi:hypothetical protein